MAQILYNITVIKSNLLPESVRDELRGLGYTIDDTQPHLSDEGLILMRDKRVLVGRQVSDGAKVIIKVSGAQDGKDEIESEKATQDILTMVPFATRSLAFPQELFYGEHGGYLIRVTQFIEQERVFAAYTLEEQFFFALKAFEEQEAFHATTFEHLKAVKNAIPVVYARNYFERFGEFTFAVAGLDDDLDRACRNAEKMLTDSKRLIDTYCNYLTHTDFVPSNFRIRSGKIYLIDLSSMHFGNKYEGWTRFANWAIIHSPKLEGALLEYIKRNRPSEYEMFRLMRIYKTGFLLSHYAKVLKKTEGNLKILTEKRLKLWQTIMESFLRDIPVPKDVIDQYRTDRDTLRSTEELERQKEFNLL